MVMMGNPQHEEEVLSVMDSLWKGFSYTDTVFSSEKSQEIVNSILMAKGLEEHSRKDSIPKVSDLEEHSRNNSTLMAKGIEEHSRKSSILKARGLEKHSGISVYKKFIYAAAAAIVLLVASTIILKLVSVKPDTQVSSVVTVEDILPGGDKATLTLADGSVILLDSAANGLLSKQGNIQVMKLSNGQLVYNPTGENAKSLFNRVSTPRGGQYRLVLADGTKVWLNAESSLRYPAAFTGKERRVELIGEAYFEVEKNASMPFRVTIQGKGEIEVLGTRFNVNSYADELNVKTTLLEGSVKITPGSGKTINRTLATYLSPDQQATISASGEVSVEEIRNAENIIAWKNGKFNFGEGSDITDIMRQISRWYDVDVEYTGAIDARIGGVISRDVNVSKVLEMLEMTGALKFEIQGRKVIVKPVK
jgi:ferric-dicitrate binding protein FerR (iron transport regulator)